MSTRNIPFSIYRRKSAYIIPNLKLLDFFFKGLKDEFETAVVNESSVFEPLKFYCSWLYEQLMAILAWQSYNHGSSTEIKLVTGPTYRHNDPDPVELY